MRKVTLIALVGTAGALAFACSSQTFSSSSGDGGTNTGGSDTGGSSSAGGASGSAGSLQMGGVSSTGGARATGGASGTAGSLGSGGHATGGAGAGGRASGGTGGGSTGGASGGGGIGTSCRADGDCSHQNSLYCAAPGAFVGCGNCPSPGLIPSSTTDAECNPDSGGTSICVGACDGACPLKQCGCARIASDIQGAPLQPLGSGHDAAQPGVQ